MNMFKKLKNSKKGFTLVELIVILVILAILAAILVPALLGYIDKAKQKQYTEEAHSIYTAAQAYEDELYAMSKDPEKTETSANLLAYINEIVDPTAVTKITITTKDNTAPTSGDTAAVKHEKYTISTMIIEFTSQNGTAVKMAMDTTGTWIFE